MQLSSDPYEFPHDDRFADMKKWLMACQLKIKNLKNIELQELTEQEYANDRFKSSELE